MPRAEYKTRFDQCDLDHFEEARPRLGLLPSYDIVLALNVIQKLKTPREFLLSIAELAGRVFVYSGPHVVLCDARSNNVPVDIEEVLTPAFRLEHVHDGRVDPTRGHLGVRMIFTRAKKNARPPAGR